MKITFRKVLALLLVCVTIAALAACGSKTGTGSGTSSAPASGASSAAPASASAAKPSAAPASTAPKKDTLTVALSQDSGTLDPMFNIGFDCMNALRMVYEPLWEVTADGKINYVLATGMEAVSPTVWRIKLRQGVTFSNGNKLTADDVAFTLYRANHRPGASALLTYLDTDKTKVIDDYTIEVTWKQYRVGAETEVWPSVYMFDKESFDEKTVATKAMGTGPYTMTEQVINSRWVVTKRDGYWGDAPAFKTITFKVLSEDTQRVNALQTGTVDMSSVPFQDIKFVQTLKSVNVVLSGNGQSKAIFMNVNPRSPFAGNEDARRAVAYSIDRQAIVDVAYSGFSKVSALPCANGRLDQEDRFTNIGIYKTGQDIEKAKALAKSSGLVNKEVLMVNNGTADSKAVAELVQDNLKKIGVSSKIWTLDSGSWLGVIFDQKQWDMAVDFTRGSTCMAVYDSETRILGGGGSYLNNPWLGSEKFLGYTKTLMGEPDPKKRSDAIMEMTQILADSLPWYSLCDLQTATAYNKDLKGFHQMYGGNTIYSRLSW